MAPTKMFLLLSLCAEFVSSNYKLSNNDNVSNQALALFCLSLCTMTQAIMTFKYWSTELILIIPCMHGLESDGSNN